MISLLGFSETFNKTIPPVQTFDPDLNTTKWNVMVDQPIYEAQTRKWLSLSLWMEEAGAAILSSLLYKGELLSSDI